MTTSRAHRKRTDRVRQPKAAQSKDAGEELTTFSVRLNPSQRDLVQRASSVKGWTPTGLIRTATLQRAAHIVNMNRWTTFDFRAVATELAKGLFDRPAHQFMLGRAELAELEYQEGVNPDDSPVLKLQLPSLQSDAADRLAKAAQLGGTEFLQVLVDLANELTFLKRPDLPEPIDPRTLE